jgi:hypothetical protein
MLIVSLSSLLKHFLIKIKLDLFEIILDLTERNNFLISFLSVFTFSVAFEICVMMSLFWLLSKKCVLAIRESTFFRKMSMCLCDIQIIRDDQGTSCDY